MKRMSKIVFQVSLTAFIVVLVIIQVKAFDIKPKVSFQQSKMFVAWVFDEKGSKMEGATGRIKGREDKPLDWGQTSGRNKPIVIVNYPANAIIVISKPGYVTREIDTKTLYKPKNSSVEEFDKAVVKIKMVPVKKGIKQPAVKKKKV